jgi:hypothetical protein
MEVGVLVPSDHMEEEVARHARRRRRQPTICERT